MPTKVYVVMSVDSLDIDSASGMIPKVTVCGVTSDLETAEKLRLDREALLRTRVWSVPAAQRWLSVQVELAELVS